MIDKRYKQELRASINALEILIFEEFKQFVSCSMTCSSAGRKEEYEHISMITGYCYENCIFRDWDDPYDFDVDEDDLQAELDTLKDLINDMNELKVELYAEGVAISERKALKAEAKLKASRQATSQQEGGGGYVSFDIDRSSRRVSMRGGSEEGCG